MARSERSVVVGTAGHIDHGKTTLVRALTGTDTDRLPEEKRRGITIELGFATWNVAPGIHASIVDVPGHEAFVRTMVAGAGGIDLLLLIVSAEDGVMPQTREHVHICQLLGIEHAIVALTKADAVESEELLELAVDEVQTELASTPYANARVIPCSGTTGLGVPDLTRLVKKKVSELARRNATGDPILPLDRVFTMKGHGTVVTGTLLTGTLDLARDDLLVIPGGARREAMPVRIRGIQVRGDSVSRVRAGARVALNLGGVDVDALARGDVIAPGCRVRRGAVVHARLRHLAHGRTTWNPGTSLQVCLGTANVPGHLDPLPGTLPPGESGLVRIRLEQPQALWWGQRVVVRAFTDPGSGSGAASHGKTVGGGVLVDPKPSRGRGQRPRWLAVGMALTSDDPTVRASALVRDAGLEGIESPTLEFRAGVANATNTLEGIGGIVRLDGGRFVDMTSASKLKGVALREADAFHDHNPIDPGIGRATLEASLGVRVTPALATRVVDGLLDNGELVAIGGGAALARPGRGVGNGANLPAEVQRVLDVYLEAGVTPPTLKDVGAACELPAPRVMKAVTLLQRTERLVRISDQISMARDRHDTLVADIQTHLADHGDIDVQALKSLAGLSRKYAVPFLEHLDQINVTRRVGDRRIAARS